MSTFSSALLIPDSLLAKEATETVRQYSTDLLFNHSIRVYLFAAEQGQLQGWHCASCPGKRFRLTPLPVVL